MRTASLYGRCYRWLRHALRLMKSLPHLRAVERSVEWHRIHDFAATRTAQIVEQARNSGPASYWKARSRASGATRHNATGTQGHRRVCVSAVRVVGDGDRAWRRRQRMNSDHRDQLLNVNSYKRQHRPIALRRVHLRRTFTDQCRNACLEEPCLRHRHRHRTADHSFARYVNKPQHDDERMLGPHDALSPWCAKGAPSSRQIDCRQR